MEPKLHFDIVTVKIEPFVILVGYLGRWCFFKEGYRQCIDIGFQGVLIICVEMRSEMLLDFFQTSNLQELSSAGKLSIQKFLSQIEHNPSSNNTLLKFDGICSLCVRSFWEFKTPDWVIVTFSRSEASLCGLQVFTLWKSSKYLVVISKCPGGNLLWRRSSMLYLFYK